MTVEQVISYLGGVGGLGGLGLGLVALLRVRPEARKTNADAANVLATSSVGYADKLEERLDKLQGEFDAWRAGQQRRDREHDRMLRVHARWDDRVADAVRQLGGAIEDPPPLYPSDNAA